MDNSIHFQSRRSSVFGKRGMVAASQPLAVAAGLSVLRQGGNAADAAVATAAALNVTEPMSTGIGGDCFALYFQASTQQIFALNGSGRAPASLTIERLYQEGLRGDRIPLTHPHAVTVPGAAAGWHDLVERFGRLPLAKVLTPAIELAENGFPVAPLTSIAWKKDVETKLSRTPNGLELTIDGRAPEEGEIFRNPGLAHTLQTVAEGGKTAFYQGPIAAAIAAIVQAAGGCLDENDLASHESTWEQPICCDYHDLRIWECPPNGQGLAALLALSILRGFDLKQLSPLSTERLHLEIEAMRLAFADAFHYIADPSFFPAPLNELLSEEYAAQRRKQINLSCASSEMKHGVPVASSDTVYLSVVDGEGNACSFINSNYMGFGTGIVPQGYGFALQNRGCNFTLDPNHPNALQPGKRPYHTIIPAMATRISDGSLYACYGVMGGFMQPQGHLQVTVALADDQLDPQSALDRPRFCIEPFHTPVQVLLEDGIPWQSAARLADMGHHVKPVTGFARTVFGRGQIIRRNPQNGVLWAGSDPRADGCSMPLE